MRAWVHTLMTWPEVTPWWVSFSVALYLTCLSPNLEPTSSQGRLTVSSRGSPSSLGLQSRHRHRAQLCVGPGDLYSGFRAHTENSFPLSVLPNPCGVNFWMVFLLFLASASSHSSVSYLLDLLGCPSVALMFPFNFLFTVHPQKHSSFCHPNP